MPIAERAIRRKNPAVSLEDAGPVRTIRGFVASSLGYPPDQGRSGSPDAGKAASWLVEREL
jgi:hypothetical protein